jgi:Regulator of chromosome condensation (RCC1) repeat
MAQLLTTGPGAAAPIGHGVVLRLGPGRPGAGLSRRGRSPHDDGGAAPTVSRVSQRVRGLDHETAHWTGRMVGGFIQDASSGWVHPHHGGWLEFGLALRSDGISAVTSVWTWGSNSVRKLGDGTRTSRPIPVRVTGVPAHIAGISAGATFAAAMGTQRLGLELGQRRQRPAGRRAHQLPGNPAGQRDRGWQRNRPAGRGRRAHARAEVGRHCSGPGYNLYSQVGNGTTANISG